jgi:hypothetical protein
MKLRFLPLLLLPLFSNAQSNVDSLFIKKMSDEIMTNGKAYDLLYELTKKIGGRLAGSPQAQNAVVWGKKSLEAMGPDKVFLQPCKVPNWKRGGKDFVAIVGVNGEARMQPLAAMALGNSLGSNGLIEAEVVAVASFEELEKRKDEVKGKIVSTAFLIRRRFRRLRLMARAALFAVLELVKPRNMVHWRC